MPALPRHQHGTTPATREHAGRWPLRSYLPLGAWPGAVPCARVHTRLVLREWGLGELTGVAELTVSELVTNSVQASAGLEGSWFGGRYAPGRPPVRLWLQSEGRQVLIQVWDGNDHLPRSQRPGPGEEHGRGLLLVEHLCAACGAYPLAGSSGKVVWALASPLPASR